MLNGSKVLVSLLAVLMCVSVYRYMYVSHGSGRRVLSESLGSDSLKLESAYSQWTRKYGKLYGTPSEMVYRKKVFSKNMQKVESVNTRKLAYTLELNAFADLTKEEMIARYTGLGKIQAMEEARDRTPVLTSKRILTFFPNLFDMKGDGLPEEKDWHKEEALNPIKHQGSCGSCYSFSAILALEQAYYVQYGQKIKLSEQELVDCSKGHGNTGCIGGWMHQAFDYVLENKGIQLAKNYPYESIERQFCNRDTSKNVKNIIKGYKRIDIHDNDSIKRALVRTVVTAGVDITDISLYNSGVYDNRECADNINHAIVIVGYGVSRATGQKYWKVRNSWGEGWGEKGYFYLLRDEGIREGVCGITQYNVYPTF